MNKKAGVPFLIVLVIIIAVTMTLYMQQHKTPDVDPNLNSANSSEQTINNGDTEVSAIYLTVNQQTLEVKLEENSSTKALLEKLSAGTVTVEAEDYGGFEKVGGLGFTLPTSDTRITTKPGDLILYNGNQLTLHYGSNEWSYTKLGHIDLSQDELKAILGDGNVTIVLSLTK